MALPYNTRLPVNMYPQAPSYRLKQPTFPSHPATMTPEQQGYINENTGGASASGRRPSKQLSPVFNMQQPGLPPQTNRQPTDVEGQLVDLLKQRYTKVPEAISWMLQPSMGDFSSPERKEKIIAARLAIEESKKGRYDLDTLYNILATLTTTRNSAEVLSIQERIRGGQREWTTPGRNVLTMYGL